MNNASSTAILVCHYWLVNYYLEKCLVIIEHNSKHFISNPNDVKLRIHAIVEQKTDHVMACYIAISSVANTLKKFHIQYNFFTVYKQNFYHNKQDKFDEIFDQYYLPLLKYIDHPAFIQEWRENLDGAAYKNNLNK